MAESFLHNLEDLPGAAPICLVGERNRNARFLNFLNTCRPDNRPSHVIDIATTQPFFDGSSLTDALSRASLSPDEFLLITSGKYKPICILLRDMGFDRVHILNPNFTHPFLQPKTDAEVDQHAQRLLEAKRILSTDQDRSFYDLIIWTLHQKTDFRHLYSELLAFHSRMGRQYLDFIFPAEIRTVIEGGVEDGQNAIEFLGSFPGPTIHGFEPDDSVYGRSYLRQYLEAHPGVHIHPHALWSKPERLAFQNGKPGRSRISRSDEPSPDSTVNATSIDAFVQSNGISKIDYIKLDIEGSELEALHGAREVLVTHRPQLAICVYHKLEHYYQIPLFLAECTTDYVFRIGHYSAFYLFSETVLYGIPRELHTR